MPAARIAHFHDHQPVLLAVGLHARELVGHPGHDRQLAALRHGLNGVFYDVQEDLDQLVPVAEHLGQARIVQAGKDNIALPRVLFVQQQHVVQDAVDIAGLHFQRLQAREIEDAFKHLVQAVRLLQDHVEIFELAFAGSPFCRFADRSSDFMSCAAPLMPTSGFFTSWAMPAAIIPSVASRSDLPHPLLQVADARLVP